MISINKLLVLASLLLQVNGFTISQPMTVSSRTSVAQQHRVVAQMSDDKKGGDLYDDETPEYKDPLSGKIIYFETLVFLYV